MKKELQVAALENGTVIDHIPNDRLSEVVRLLCLETIKDSSIMIGYNLDSHKMGKKSLIKISDHYFSDEELNQLSVIAPHISLSIIRNFEVAEKRQVELPKELVGIVKCPNHKCITNNELMQTMFHSIKASKTILQCHYCEKEIDVDEAKFC